ncbi:methyl-accepting chemotaxis protein [Halorussus halobius]|uniref:methyl-accepting chemotaxis protein n=1 Tax=Halorussus halobius TaxID=1710537 RepID=UPI0010930BB1|nr:methyl-accepting chemotaxis protein [Halorussus halobius]
MGQEWPLLGRVRGSYALKLAFALVAVIALTVAVGALVQAQTDEQLRQDVEAELTTVSESQSGTLDTWLSNVKRQSRLTSEHPAVTAGETNRTRELMRGLIDRDGVPEGVVAVHYYDADERTIVTSSSDEFVGVNPARQNMPFATQPPSFDGPDEVYVSEPFRTSTTDFPVVAVISPVPDDPDRRVVYMVNIEERTQSLTGTVEGGSTLVLDSAGRYLVHSDTDQLLTTHGEGADDPVVERGLAGESGFRQGSDGMLLAYAPVEAADWVVVVRVPESQAFALGATVTSNIVGLILISVVSLALIGVTVGSNTVVALRQLSRRADNMAGGDLGVRLETDRTDEFGSLYDSFARMRDSLRDQIREAEQAHEESEQAREEAERAREEAERRSEEARQLSEHLEAKASHYEQAMDAVADGDLTVRVDPESRSDAMVAIGESLNDTLAEIERTVASVKRFAAHVSNAVAEVETAAEGAMATGEEVDGSMTEISEGAARQTERLGEVLDEMNTLSATAEEIAATVDDVATTSEQAAREGELGREAAEDAVAELDAIEAVTTETATQIEELEEEVAAIGEVVEVISDIAEQTNMLALNASIEAARADVDGDGFAVVAAEVKELAEETKESATEIEDRIERVQSKTAESVEGVAETSERVDAGVETVEGAIESLEDIAEYVEETDASIAEISDATDEQATSATAVVDTVEDVANISEETTSRAGTASEATATQTEQLASVQDDAGDLADRAAELGRLLDDFRVAQGAGPTDEPDPDSDSDPDPESDSDAGPDADSDFDFGSGSDADSREVSDS